MIRALPFVALAVLILCVGVLVSASRRNEAEWSATVNAIVVPWAVQTFETEDVRLLRCVPWTVGTYRCTLSLGPVRPRQIVTVECDGKVAACVARRICEK